MILSSNTIPFGQNNVIFISKVESENQYYILWFLSQASYMKQ